MLLVGTQPKIYVQHHTTGLLQIKHFVLDATNVDTSNTDCEEHTQIKIVWIRSSLKWYMNTDTDILSKTRNTATPMMKKQRVLSHVEPFLIKMLCLSQVLKYTVHNCMSNACNPSLSNIIKWNFVVTVSPEAKRNINLLFNVNEPWIITNILIDDNCNVKECIIYMWASTKY